MSEKKKVITNQPGRPKGVTILGGSVSGEKGVEIVEQHKTIKPGEVTILDKNSKTETPPVEITYGEGDRDGN